MDALTYAGNLDNLRELENDAGHVFVHADIRDRSTMAGLIRDHHVDAIVHFAAESHVDRASIGGCRSSTRTSSARTAARRRSGGGHLRVCRSRPTRCTAASARPAPSPKTTPLAPNSPYAASKAAADLLVRGLSPHARAGRRHHPLLEQLRPVPVPREADPPVHHQRPGRQPPARLRRRPPGPRLDPRRRPLPRRRRGLRRGRAGEVYNFGGRERADNLDVTPRCST